MATEVERLIVTLEATTKQYERALANAQNVTVKNLRQMEGEASKFERNFSSRMAKAGRDGGRRFSGALKASLAGALGALSIGTVTHALQEAIKSLADLGDAAETLGLSAQDLQVFNRMMLEAGGSTEQMSKALAQVAQQAQNPKSKLSQLFADFGKTPTGDVKQDMLTLMELLQRMGTNAERTGALMDVFGKKLGAALAEPLETANNYSKTLDDLRSKNQLVTNQQIEDARRLDAELNILQTTLQVELAKAVLDAVGNWQNFRAQGEAAIKVIVNAFKELVTILQQIATLVTGLGQLFEKFLGTTSPFGGDPWSDLRKLGILPPLAGAGTGGTPGARESVLTEQLAGRFGQQVARGIIAALKGESSTLDPMARGRAGEVGFAQWHLERRQELEQLAAAAGKSVNDWGVQLGFFWKELTGQGQTFKTNVAAMLDNAKTAEEAVEIMVRAFEKPADIPGEIARRKGFLMQGPPAPAATTPTLPEGFDLSKVETIDQTTEAWRRYTEEIVKAGDAQTNLQTSTAATDTALQSQQQVMSSVFDAIHSAASTFVHALIEGKSASEALRAALAQLGQQLIDLALDIVFAQLKTALLGGIGGIGGGLTGGLAAPALQHGGSFRVGGMGGTDNNLVPLRLSRGEIVTVTPNRMVHPNSYRGHTLGPHIGGPTINIMGNPDERTIAMIDQKLQRFAAQQRHELIRDWGRMQYQYQTLRGP